VNYATFDLCLGILIIASGLGLQIINIWLFLVTMMVGMNLGTGNLRYFYNKKFKKKVEA